jgi:hypothetical protein
MGLNHQVYSTKLTKGFVFQLLVTILPVFGGGVVGASLGIEAPRWDQLVRKHAIVHESVGRG